MELNTNDIGHVEGFSCVQILTMFVGFIIFMSGTFLIAYSIIAWFLVATIELSLVYCALGAFSAYAGRRLIRVARKQRPLVKIT